LYIFLPFCRCCCREQKACRSRMVGKRWRSALTSAGLCLQVDSSASEVRPAHRSSKRSSEGAGGLRATPLRVLGCVSLLPRPCSCFPYHAFSGSSAHCAGTSKHCDDPLASVPAAQVGCRRGKRLQASAQLLALRRFT
jgi:hypothetical protein